MTKLLKTLTVLLGMIMLSSCLKEDLSDCLPSNVYLTFRYTGNTTDDLSWFNKMIDRVNLYVFDSNGKLVTNAVQQLEKNVLTKYTPARTKLYLSPGEYTVICWGNTFDNTHISSLSMETGRVNHPDYGTIGKTIATQDHSYYALQTIKVLEAGNTSEDVVFKGAHVNLEVVMKGITEKLSTESYPYVEVQNVMPSYTIDMQEAAPYNQTYVPAVGWSDDDMANFTSLQVFRFSDDNPLQVVVKNHAQDKTFVTVDLMQAMKDGNITVDKLNEATVRLILDFTDYWNDLSVKISIEGWSKENSIPEL